MDKQDFSKLPSMYERIETSTDTPQELEHRLFMEKLRLILSALGVAAIFAVTVAIIFFHEDKNMVNSAQTILQTLSGGFIGYMVRK